MERLLLFARRPRRGEVKTRLVLPEERVLDLYRAFLVDQIGFVARLARGDRIGVLYVDDGGPFEERDLAAALGLEIARQGPGDLGERLARAFARSAEEGAEATVVIAADAPTLPADHVERAFSLLHGGADVVLAPALDGGYVLLGARGPRPELFRGIAWGDDSVARETRERARGLRLAELPAWGDVDTVEDLARLEAETESSPARAPATRRALARA